MFCCGLAETAGAAGRGAATTGLGGSTFGGSTFGGSFCGGSIFGGSAFGATAEGEPWCLGVPVPAGSAFGGVAEATTGATVVGSATVSGGAAEAAETPAFEDAESAAMAAAWVL